MTELVADCPRCGAKQVTFNVLSDNSINKMYNWQQWYEAFCVCRHCMRSTIFILYQSDYDYSKYLCNGLANLDGNINLYLDVSGYVSVKDVVSFNPPEYLPDDIASIFREGATCLAVECFNAAGTMFRLCIDKSTRIMLPADDTQGLNAKIRRNLGLRLPWLFDTGRLPEALRELSECIKDDGNDGAHEGTLTKEDAEDLVDFTYSLLERIYTEPKRLQLAKERRNLRRKVDTSAS